MTTLEEPVTGETHSEYTHKRSLLMQVLSIITLAQVVTLGFSDLSAVTYCHHWVALK